MPHYETLTINNHDNVLGPLLDNGASVSVDSYDPIKGRIILYVHPPVSFGYWLKGAGSVDLWPYPHDGVSEEPGEVVEARLEFADTNDRVVCVRFLNGNGVCVLRVKANKWYVYDSHPAR